MDFSLTDEQRMIQQSIRRFCKRELDPIADYFIVVTRTSGEKGVHGNTNFILERGSEGMSRPWPSFLPLRWQ